MVYILVFSKTNLEKNYCWYLKPWICHNLPNTAGKKKIIVNSPNMKIMSKSKQTNKKGKQNRGWSDSTSSGAFALHTADPVQPLASYMVPRALPGMTLSTEPRVTPAG